MSDILTNLSPAALVTAIEENLVGLVASFYLVPGASIYRDGTMVRYSAPVYSPMYNGVIAARFTPEEADAKIDEVIQYFTALQTPRAFWWVFPSTNSPADLGARLLAHGYALNIDNEPGMAADLTTLNEDINEPPGFTVERVTNDESLRAWGKTFAAGNEIPEIFGQSWVEATSGVGKRMGIERAPWRLYTGWLNGEPVATSLLFLGAGVAGIYGVGTIPSARRQGIGALITLKPLLEARAEGYRVGVLEASAAGEPVYRRLGFQEYCRMDRYLWRLPEDTNTDDT